MKNKQENNKNVKLKFKIMRRYSVLDTCWIVPSKAVLRTLKSLFYSTKN